MDELEQVTTILDAYQSNKLFSIELRQDLIGHEASFNNSQDLDDNHDCPDNVKQLEVDGKLLRTLDYDLASYETYLSAVQFYWVEAAAKENFIASTIFDDDGLDCSDNETQKLLEANLQHESELKTLQATIAQEEEKVFRMTQEIQERYTGTQATYKLNRALTNDIADLELELNELKINQKEDDSELMTISEATEAGLELEKQLTQISNQLSINYDQIPKLKAQFVKESKLVDQLRIERNAIEKVEGDRRRTLGGRTEGSSIAKLESGRTWFTTVTQTYKAAMGILSINVLGPNPVYPNKLQIKFGLRNPLTGTLVIEFTDCLVLGTQIISAAYLDQSSQDISIVVEPFIRENDLTLLILSVRHFLVRLQSSLPEN